MSSRLRGGRVGPAEGLGAGRAGVGGTAAPGHRRCPEERRARQERCIEAGESVALVRRREAPEAGEDYETPVGRAGFDISSDVDPSLGSCLVSPGEFLGWAE